MTAVAEYVPTSVLVRVPLDTPAPSWATHNSVEANGKGEVSGFWSRMIDTIGGEIEVCQNIYCLPGEDTLRVSPAYVEMGGWGPDSYLDAGECLAFAYGLRQALELMQEADAAALALVASS